MRFVQAIALASVVALPFYIQPARALACSGSGSSNASNTSNCDGGNCDGDCGGDGGMVGSSTPVTTANSSNPASSDAEVSSSPVAPTVNTEPAVPGNASSPITITSGGTYTGNWTSTNGQPAVTIATTAPVTILDSDISGTGTLIQSTVLGAQIVIRNCTATGLNPNVSGQAPGQFAEIDSAASVDIEHNAILNCGGYVIHLKGYAGNGSTQTFTIDYNTITDTNGRFSDGNGGYSSSGQGTPHAIIFESVAGVPGAEIAWNQIVNTPGQSYVNDCVNMYDSSGTAAAPLTIHDNYIDGLYAIDPASQYDSGCGIITDGEANGSESAYVQIYNNEIVSTSNAGIGIAAGHDVSAYNNRVISSGYYMASSSATVATAVYGTNVGIYAWDQMSGGSGATYYNIAVYNNTVGWVQAAHSMDNTTSADKESNWWLPDADGNTSGNQTTGSFPTLATEAAEVVNWTSKTAASLVTLGVDIIQ